MKNSYGKLRSNLKNPKPKEVTILRRQNSIDKTKETGSKSKTQFSM